MYRDRIILDAVHEYETVEQLIERNSNFLDKLKERDDKNILLVTHNGMIRAIEVYFNGIPQNKDLVNLGIKNCEVKEYYLENGGKNAEF